MQNKTKRWILILLLIIPLVLAITCTLNRSRMSQETAKMTVSAEKLDAVVSDTMPLGRTLRQLGLKMRYRTGENKQEDVFISSNGLMKDIQPVDDARLISTNRNLEMIAEYARDMGISSYLAILPSSSAILQQNLPLFFSTVNQKNVIDNIYNQFSGKIITINSYNTLLENRDKYIYYRTEDNLTPLGGYYVYKDIIRRIWVSESALPQNNFLIEYADNNFYGELYKKVPYAPVQPDSLMLYHSNDELMQHKIEKTINRQTKVYNTLYPVYAKELDNKMDIYLGGEKGVTDITTSNTYDADLLIFADHTFLSYVPFLTNHYSRITVVNPFDEIGSNMDTIRFKDYDQILFAFDVENYTCNLDLSVVIEVIENQWYDS